MFAACNPEISRDNFRDLIMTAYKLAMDHYPEGAQTCIKIYRTIQSVLDSAVSYLIEIFKLKKIKK